MTKERYLLTFAHRGRDYVVSLVYANGLLVRFEAPADMDEILLRWFHNNLPYRIERAREIVNKSATAKLEVVAPDLSFEAFWEGYGKGYHKQRAAKLWEQLDDYQRTRALAHLPKYHYHLKTTNVNKALAATYLKERYWVQ